MPPLFSLKFDSHNLEELKHRHYLVSNLMTDLECAHCTTGMDCNLFVHDFIYTKLIATTHTEYYSQPKTQYRCINLTYMHMVRYFLLIIASGG